MRFKFRSVTDGGNAFAGPRTDAHPRGELIPEDGHIIGPGAQVSEFDSHPRQ